MSEDLLKINLKLLEILSQEKGYFGRIDTFGQRPTKYEYIGYKLDTDFLPTLKKMSEGQKINLVKIINYFDIHASSLKKMLNSDKKESLYDVYSKWAWSHFMTVVMFGMLEVAVKITSCAEYKDKNKLYLKKYESIKKFLETFLSQKIRDDIASRYKTEEGTKLGSFSEVIKHLWDEIRSGFIHEAGVHSKGLEWYTFKGLGSKEDPLTIETDVPMEELMQITWQAILNSCGYTGLLCLSEYESR